MKINVIRWEDSRVEHIMERHGIRPEEAEDVCHGPNFVQKVRYGRYAIYGQTAAGRYVMVVVNPLGNGVFETITARDMTDVERRRYRQKGK